MSQFDALEYFKQVYDEVPEWVAKMHRYAPKALEHYTLLRNEIMVDGALPKKEKELILVGINAARRYERSMLYHTKGAVDSGATVEEVADVIATCIVSRGIPAWLTGVKAVEYAISYTGEEGDSGASLSTGQLEENTCYTLEQCERYYEQEAGSIPGWVQILKQTNPAVLQKYTDLRSTVLRDHVVSRKVKELLLIGINVAERYREGVKIHVEGAKKWGATDAEIADVSLVALLTAGIPAWFEGSDFL